jgi:hypothetical protein
VTLRRVALVAAGVAMTMATPSAWSDDKTIGIFVVGLAAAKSCATITGDQSFYKWMRGRARPVLGGEGFSGDQISKMLAHVDASSSAGSRPRPTVAS